MIPKTQRRFFRLPILLLLFSWRGSGGCRRRGGRTILGVCGALAFRPQKVPRETTTAPSGAAAPKRISQRPAPDDSLITATDGVRSGAAATTGLALCCCLLLLPLPPASPGTGFLASAYDPTDYASETVQSAVQSLRDAAGNPDATYEAYGTVADIITEGRGLGGAVNYRGVQLERGYVADEDTSVYNPGLTLLTESEKERLVEAVLAVAPARPDNDNNAAAVELTERNRQAAAFLKAKLDPFHVTELRGYLHVVPVLSAGLYLAVLAVQQLAPDRGWFQAAYLLGVFVFFAPAVLLVTFAGL